MSFANRLINRIEKSHPLYLVTILVFITLFIYGNSFFNGFVWDDEEQIVNNSIIKHLSNIPSLFTTSTFNTGGAGLSGWYYKPLMPIVFSINFFIWGLSPFGFHLFDVILHIINGVLVFIFFKKLFNFSRHAFPKTLAFILSLIFLVHPANAESVAYISSTQELLYTFFLLLALILSFLKQRLLFINIAILLSLLSKESGIAAIPLVILLTFLFNRSKTLIISISSLTTFSIYLLLRFALAKTPFFQKAIIIPIANASFLQRLQTIPYELFSYLRLFLFPKDLFVAQHTVITNFFDPRFYVALPLVVIVFAFLILFYFKLRSKLYLFFLAWVFFSLSLLLNIYPLDMTIAERWLYAPMIGLLGLTGFLTIELLKKNEKIKLYVLIIISLIIPIFIIRTLTRTFDWKDNLSLFSHDIHSSYQSFDVQNNLGVALFRNGDLEKAKKHFQTSTELSPRWWTPYNNLGVVYQREGNINKAKELYRISIKNGNYYLAYENLAELKYKTEKPKDILPFLETALAHLPQNEILNKIAALTYFQLGATDSAKLYGQRAYLINPSQDNYLLLQIMINQK